MNDAVSGDAKTKATIKTYLTSRRESIPSELFRLPVVHSLQELKQNPGTVGLRPELFAELLANATDSISGRYMPLNRLVAPNRFYVGLPEGLHIGGFHSPYSVGYDHFGDSTFVTALNLNVVASADLVTIELLRSYLHDSLHASTFKLYRLGPQNAGRSAPVYRAQYGINFRKASGLSYSSVELTRQAPKAINLNLLMDGVVTIVVAEAIRQALAATPVQGGVGLQRQIFNEVIGEKYDSTVYGAPDRYHMDVLEPCKQFLAHWGGDHLTTLIVRAMISGNLERLSSHFARLMNDSKAWVKMFKRNEYE